MPFEQLNTTGFLFSDTALAFAVAHAGHGDGYDRAKTLDSGLRSWSLKIDALPDSDVVPLIDDATRAAYLYDFFMASKAAGDKPFWLKDPKDGLLYLASFADERLNYKILCSKIYSTGLALGQRRDRNTSSPILDVNWTALGAAANKAGGGTSWVFATGKSLAPGETLIVGLAAINASGWSFGARFAGNNVPADIFPDGTSPRINLFRYKNRTPSIITGDISIVVDGHTFSEAYAAFASKYELLIDSPFDATAHAAGSSVNVDSGNTVELSQDNELTIGCSGIQGPEGDAVPAIAAGAEASLMGQRAGTTGGSADSNCTIVETFSAVGSTAAVNAALTLGTSRAWQSSVAAYLIG